MDNDKRVKLENFRILYESFLECFAAEEAIVICPFRTILVLRITDSLDPRALDPKANLLLIKYTTVYLHDIQSYSI